MMPFGGRREGGVGKGIENVGGGEPAAARHADAVLHVGHVLGVVGVGGDGEAAALGFGDADEGGVEVEAFRAGVDLHGDASAGGFGGDGFKVVDEGVAVEQDAAGGVADGFDVGVFQAGGGSGRSSLRKRDSCSCGRWR
jgi:hypothetical protein